MSIPVGDKANLIQNQMQANLQSRIDPAFQLTGIPQPLNLGYSGGMSLDLAVLDRITGDQAKTNALLTVDTSFQTAVKVWNKVITDPDKSILNNFISTFGPPVSASGYTGILSLAQAIQSITSKVALETFLVDSAEIKEQQKTKKPISVLK